MTEKKIIDRNYGSIPHLSISKLTQQADKKIHEGQETMLTKKARDWKDLVIVTEKLDGSNVGIINRGGNYIALARAGHEATTSLFKQHHIFKDWVDCHIHLFYLLPEGWRITGEWMIQAHGTLYDISECSPFVVFDIFDSKNKRIPFIEQVKFCAESLLTYVPIIHIGQPVSIKNAVKLLGDGKYGLAEKPEGLVYRMERAGKFDYLAKFVRSDKVDGKYMKEEIWNTGFDESKILKQ